MDKLSKAILPIALIATAILIFSIVLKPNLADQSDYRNRSITSDTESLNTKHFENKTSIFLSRKDILNDNPKIDQSTNQKLNIAPCGSEEIRWRVLGPLSNPIENAKVVLLDITKVNLEDFLTSNNHHDYPIDRHEAYTESDGAFYFSDELNPGEYLLHAEKEGFAPVYTNLTYPDSWSNQLDVSLKSSRTIKGAVIDMNHEPVPDVEVDLSLPYGNIWSIPKHEAINLCIYNTLVKTDNKGLFVATDQPFDDLHLTIEENVDKGYAKVHRFINSTETSEQVITLRGTCTIFGKITNSENIPLSKAVVDIVLIGSDSLEQNGLPVYTDEQGMYRFEGIKEGKSFITAKHADYGNALKSMLVKRKEEKCCNVKIPNGGCINIFVKNSYDEALEGIDVSVVDVDTGSFLYLYKTDNSGKCTVPSVISSHNLLISANESYSNNNYMSDSCVVEVEKSTVIELKLNRFSLAKIYAYDNDTKKPILSYHAYKSDSSSKNSELSRLEVLDVNATDDGCVATKFLDGRVLTYYIYAEGYMPHKEVILIDEHSEDEIVREVYLKKSPRLCGFVLDEVSHEPVVGAEVELVGCSQKTQAPYSIRVNELIDNTSVDGSFELKSVFDADCYLQIRCPGYSQTNISARFLKTNTEPERNAVYMSKGANVFGTLLLESGGPADSSIVKVYDHMGSFIKKVNANYDGTYKLRDLPLGVVTIAVTQYADFVLYGQCAHFKKSVELNAGDNLQLDWVFKGSSFVRGLCTQDGEPLDGMEVSLIDSSTNVIVATGYTYFNGYYDIRPIPEGNYILEAHSGIDGIGGTIRREVVLKADEGITQDFDFGEVCLKGQVKGVDGKPVYGCWLTLDGVEGQGTYKGFTDYFGTYQFFEMPSGSYRAQIRAPGYSEILSDIDIHENSVATKDFELSPEGVLRLQLLDENGKEHLQSKILVTYPEEYGGDKVSNDRGLFVIKNLPEGKISVLAGGGSCAPAPFSTALVAGETVDKEMRLVEGGTLLIKARSAEGAPVPRAAIHLPWSGMYGVSWSRLVDLGFIDTSNSSFRTDANGVFKVSNLPPGTYSISVTYGNAVWSDEIEVKPSETIEARAAF